MISIAEAISDLLFVRDTVVVSGLGAFVKKPVSATVNPTANYFAMPSSVIEFDANLREDNDLVINYMAEKNDIPEDEARRLLMMFVSDCFNSLKSGKKVKLNNIGTLSYDWAGDIEFQQDEHVNYNADAFGLCDFSPEPVFRSKSKEEIKAEIERQQKDKNTPVTVDVKAVHEDDADDEEVERRYAWLWILLALILLGGVIYGLYHFKIIDFSFWKGQEEIPVVPFDNHKKPDNELPVVLPDTLRTDTVTADTTQALSYDTLKVATPADTCQAVADSIVVKPTPEAPIVLTPSVEHPEANIRIIAGCFAQEENAQRMANSLIGKGYENAFVEKRGSKWFVAFGRYATDEEATAALREIRTNGDDKAWILK